jgi:CBS domain-containing protein
MEKYKVSQLIVLEGDRPYGMIHFHDILKEGIR